MLAAFLLALTGGLVSAGQAQAQTFVPCNDIPALKAAITQANTSGQAIILAPGCTYTLTTDDNDDNGLPVITGNVRISSAGATIRRAPTAPEFRLLEVASGGALTLNSLILRGGQVPATGGGILSRGALALNATTVRDNQANRYGGGIHNAGGTMTMSGGALRNNTATSYGGGLENWPGSTATLNAVSITGNTTDFGGGIYNTSTVQLLATRVADNTPDNTPDNCAPPGSVLGCTNPLTAEAHTPGDSSTGASKPDGAPPNRLKTAAK